MDDFWGDRELLTDVRLFRCKGNWLAARKRHVLERWGDAGVERLHAAMSPEVRRYFDAVPMPFMWRPYKQLCDVDQVIFDVLMMRSRHEMHVFGAAVARYDLAFVYRTFIRLGSPEFLLGRAKILWRQYLSKGIVTATAIEANRAHLELDDLVLPLYMCRDGIAGYLEQATQVAARSDVEVVHTACVHLGDPRCAYEVRWGGPAKRRTGY